jgi:MGT family glycosyltransferase
MKILFFHIPILGQYNSIAPVLLELAERGHAVTHYNQASFSGHSTNPSIQFKPYPDYAGYSTTAVTSRTSVYELGLLLLETAEHTVDFVESECLRERPDVILHSKFVPAAKVVANKHGVPAACLTTAFAFHPDVVRDRTVTSGSPVRSSNISSVRAFRSRAKAFYDKHLVGTSDLNDVFVNEEPLHLVLGLEIFQPRPHKPTARYRFVGPTVQLERYEKTYELIYVSLGSVFVDNPAFFEVCIRAFGNLGTLTIVSLGGRISPALFDDVPPHVELVPFVQQKEVLQRAALFVTHGGGNSVYEAIYCATPMIVIPQIPEQVVFARQIERLALGKCIVPQDLSVPLLQSTALDVLDNDVYRRNVQALKDTWPATPPAVTAADEIEDLVAQQRGRSRTAAGLRPEWSAS